ncbi:MAG: aspartate/glutamate racemase family protein [Acidobacteriota bacterium]
MKTIGLLGGMSWESTSSYYRIINEAVREKLGGLHSARICMYSVEFGEVHSLMLAGNWDAVTEILSEAAGKLETSGSDFILICTYTMHKLAPEIQKSISIPVLHIGDAAAEALARDGVKCAGLLGTRTTMQQDFGRDRFERKGIKIITPSEPDMDIVNDVIFSELCAGVFREESRKFFQDIMADMAAAGAEGIILGCTEIPLLVERKHSSVKLYDTTELHALSAVERALF